MPNVLSLSEEFHYDGCKMIISIHQPNFIPWIPYFDKIRKADIFVILKNCQFEKNGYQNRFMINNKWKTMSVRKKTQKICEKNYINYMKDWENIKKSTPEYVDQLKLFDDIISEDLSETNTNIIKIICEKLNIKTEITYDFETDLVGTDRLVDICRYHGAKKYISGVSGKKYLDLELFHSNNIEVEFQDISDLNKGSILKILKGEIYV